MVVAATTGTGITAGAAAEASATFSAATSGATAASFAAVVAAADAAEDVVVDSATETVFRFDFAGRARRVPRARRLSFVQDREATPHLVGALGDSSPDVRRAAVEALMDLRDPAAIAPLNSLLQNETDRKVSRNLISQAIEARATNKLESTAPAVSESTPSAVPDFVAPVPPPAPPSFETEREVIEL